MEPLSLAPYAQWTYEDCVKAVNIRLPDDYGIIKDYVIEHDHLRGGDEWVGPGNAKTNTSIQNQFAPDDAITEGLYNISNAFQEAQLGVVPLKAVPEGEEIPADVKVRIEEAKILLTEFWDHNQLQEVIQDRLRVSGWNGFCGLRVRVLSRFIQRGAGGDISITRIPEPMDALEALTVDTPLPEHGTIVTHTDTKDKCAIFLNTEVIVENNVSREIKRAEMVFLDPQRTRDSTSLTILKVVYEGNRQGYQASITVGGNLLFAEMEVRRLITNPVLRSQRQLNFYSTIPTRMGETAAFRERYTLNAKPFGRREPYDEAEGTVLEPGAYLERDDEGRLWQVVPEERTLGAATTTELIGLPKYNDQGNPSGNDMPGIHIADPVDPTPYINAGESIRRRIMRMISQGHLAGTSNFEVSGIAYEQSRAVFAKDLNARRVGEEGMLRKTFTAVLYLVEYITGKIGYFTSVVRVTVDQAVDAGPRSPDSVRLDLESAEAGLLSKETAMSRIGVEDIVAELSRLKNSPNYVLSVLAKAAELMNVLDPESVIEALKKMDLPVAVLELLKKKEEPKPVGAPGGALPRPPSQE